MEQIFHPALLEEFRKHNERQERIEAKLDRIISNQEEQKMTEQSNVDALTADINQVDADEKADAAQILAGQQALDTLITNLKAGQAPDLTALLAAKAVLDGDHPNLQSAVSALSADPNVTPPAPPAS